MQKTVSSTASCVLWSHHDEVEQRQPDRVVVAHGSKPLLRCFHRPLHHLDVSRIASGLAAGQVTPTAICGLHFCRRGNAGQQVGALGGLEGLLQPGVALGPLDAIGRVVALVPGTWQCCYAAAALCECVCGGSSSIVAVSRLLRYRSQFATKGLIDLAGSQHSESSP